MLSQQLSSERKAKQDAEAKSAAVTASLQGANETRDAAEQHVATLQSDIERLNAQLAQISAALDASETKSRADQGVISDLGQRLQVALAEKVAEMARYRSEFCVKCSAIVPTSAWSAIVSSSSPRCCSRRAPPSSAPRAARP
jgi:chemotaxis protein MotB